MNWWDTKVPYVLVTGCNGFIGSKLTKRLIEKGYKVLGVSSSNNRVLFHENFEYVQLNLKNAIDVENLFRKYKISSVIHLAAIAHLKGRKKIRWNEFYRINVLASKTVFRCAVNARANIFYASTVDVYGNTNVSIIDENQCPKPISDYAKSKLIAENILRDLVEKEKINYCIGRFAPVYAKNFMKDVYKRIYIIYPSLAFQINCGIDYHFVSINNILDFIELWIKKSNQISGIYNVCDNQYINSKEFIKLEKNIGNSKSVIKLPKVTISLVSFLLKIFNGLIGNTRLNEISKNLYKLTNPPKYSTKKINEFTNLKWDLKNTVYYDD